MIKNYIYTLILFIINKHLLLQQRIVLKTINFLCLKYTHIHTSALITRTIDINAILKMNAFNTAILRKSHKEVLINFTNNNFY